MVTGTVRAVGIVSYARRITLSEVELSEDAGSRRASPGSMDQSRMGRQMGRPWAARRAYRLRTPPGKNSPVSTSGRRNAGSNWRHGARARAVCVRRAARLSRRLGPPTRRVLRRPWRPARHWARCERDRDGAARPSPRLVQRLREIIAGTRGCRCPAPPGAVSVTLLTGGHRGIPPKRTTTRSAVRARASACRGRAAYRHRHGLGAGVRRDCVRRVGICQPALADEEDGGVGGAAAGGCYMVLTGMHVPIMRSLRHGVPYTRWRCSRAGERCRCAGWRLPRRR